MSEVNKWTKTRKRWIENNPPYDDYWYCVVGGRALTNEEDKLDYGALWLTLDHDVSRSRDPILRHEAENLNPMCAYHNNKKGSRSLQQYMASKPPKACRW